MFLGAGELGKEVIIEMKRLGVEVVAVDRYPHAPGMQVADRSHVISMLDADALRAVIKKEQPHYIVPEIEAIATEVLCECEQNGYTVIPTARAAQLTMDRESIRRLAVEKLRLPTSEYRFAYSQVEYNRAVLEIGLPCVVKPSMSSSGKGQSVMRTQDDIKRGWQIAGDEGRGVSGKVIVEKFIDFDYEITLLTIREKDGTIKFCAPIGHKQVDGDYRESWQPHPMSESTLERAQYVAKTVVEELGGQGIFGVELFVKGDDVIFSEVSSRPHDTGMVTLISQNISEFALHMRAILGLPIPEIKQLGPSASAALVKKGRSNDVRYDVTRALMQPDTDVRIFGKPGLSGGERRLGVALALGATIDEARQKACNARDAIVVDLQSSL